MLCVKVVAKNRVRTAALNLQLRREVDLGIETRRDEVVHKATGRGLHPQAAGAAAQGDTHNIDCGTIRQFY